MAYSEVEEVSGFVGNFRVKLRRKASYVDPEKCTGCGTCWENCPARRIPVTRVMRMRSRVIGRTPAGA
jgi:heterodisulfide reductase subunit A